LNLERELGPLLKNGIKKDEPMSRHTSWRIGGPADYLVCPVDIEEIARVVRYSHLHGIPLLVCGNGSNLLVLDGGIRGLVMKIGSPFHYIRCEEGNRIRAGSGTPMPDLARAAVRKGLAGLEFAGGIPGTLGGALIMNAGAYGGNIGSLVQSVTVVDFQGRVLELARKEIEFGYRCSSLSSAGVVAEALLQLEKGDPARSEALLEHYLQERRRKHPQLPSCGSVFRNLPDQPAGRLIEAAGGKGLRVGGAQVSEQHANFIVNTGGATAKDVLALIRKVQQLVKKKFNIELHPEVKIVGVEN
jgi:UDP-N-acetylmuramate dehydrogenase